MAYSCNISKILKYKNNTDLRYCHRRAGIIATPLPSGIWRQMKKGRGQAISWRSMLWVSFSALALVRRDWEKSIWPIKNLCHLSPQVLPWNRWKKVMRGNWLSCPHGKRPLKQWQWKNKSDQKCHCVTSVGARTQRQRLRHQFCRERRAKTTGLQCPWVRWREAAKKLTSASCLQQNIISVRITVTSSRSRVSV